MDIYWQGPERSVTRFWVAYLYSPRSQLQRHVENVRARNAHSSLRFQRFHDNGIKIALPSRKDSDCNTFLLISSYTDYHALEFLPETVTSLWLSCAIQLSLYSPPWAPQPLLPLPLAVPILVLSLPTSSLVFFFFPIYGFLVTTTKK